MLKGMWEHWAPNLNPPIDFLLFMGQVTRPLPGGGGWTRGGWTKGGVYLHNTSFYSTTFVAQTAKHSIIGCPFRPLFFLHSLREKKGHQSHPKKALFDVRSGSLATPKVQVGGHTQRR